MCLGQPPDLVVVVGGDARVAVLEADAPPFHVIAGQLKSSVRVRGLAEPALIVIVVMRGVPQRIDHITLLADGVVFDLRRRQVRIRGLDQPIIGIVGVFGNQRLQRSTRQRAVHRL